MATISEIERRAIGFLAARYEAGERQVTHEIAMESLKVDSATWDLTFRRLKEMGVINSVTRQSVYPSIGVIEAEAQIKAQEAVNEKEASIPKNRVESAKTWANSNPFVAYPFIAMLTLAAIVTFINQVWELLVKLGVVAAPK